VNASKKTKRDQETTVVKEIIEQIKSLELTYGIEMMRKACSRYTLQRRVEAKLEREIREAKEKLAELEAKAK
jgi:hypothetical protein